MFRVLIRSFLLVFLRFFAVKLQLKSPTTVIGSFGWAQEIAFISCIKSIQVTLFASASVGERYTAIMKTQEAPLPILVIRRLGLG